MRTETNKDSAPVHIFTSHFYTTLLEEGPAAVESWTAKKGIDIFSKRFIFIPVNRSAHWSLCVVTNPGSIEHRIRSNNADDIDDDDDGLDKPYPCFLFFDSLKMHRKTTITKKLREWLNAEWERLEKPALRGSTRPFTEDTMECPNLKGMFLCFFPSFRLRNQTNPSLVHDCLVWNGTDCYGLSTL